MTAGPDYGLPPEYEHVYSGKVRDLYRTPDDRLLFVASDRLYKSARDHEARENGRPPA